MFPSPILLNKETCLNRNHGIQVIERSYLVYVPKKVSFTYRISPVKINRENSGRNAERKLQQLEMFKKKSEARPKIITLKRKKQRNPQRIDSSTQLKRNKLSLCSQSKSRVNQSFSQQGSRMADKSECLPFVEQTNHISANNFVESFSCDLFSQCNGVDYVVQGDKHPLTTDDSKQTISKSDRQGLKDTKVSKNGIESLKDKSFSFSESFGNFSMRKNIFDTSSFLNSTIDLGHLGNNERSKSRKGIFQPRKSHSKSLSIEKSASTRKRIFKSPPHRQNRSNLIIQTEQESLTESQIPRGILESWQNFSESSQSGLPSRRLHIVQQANLQESQVEAV